MTATRNIPTTSAGPLAQGAYGGLVIIHDGELLEVLGRARTKFTNDHRIVLRLIAVDDRGRRTGEPRRLSFPVGYRLRVPFR